MILSLAVFAQLAASCAPDVAAQTLAGIARTESGLDPFAMLDNTTGRSYRPENQAEAVRIAAGLIAAEHSIDAGLMGINSSNWRWHQRRKSMRYLTFVAGVAVTAMITSPSYALVTGGTDPTTIITAALNLILGPMGTGLATLGLIVMLLQIARFGLAGLMIYVGIIAGIFGASYVVQQLLGTAV
jgi:type IV secretory pathway VirB2 component (pilin)